MKKDILETMKSVYLLMLALFLTISFKSYSAARNVNFQTDTLKKTSQYILFNKTDKIEDIFFSKNKKSTEQIVYVKISFAKEQPNSNAIKTAVLQGNKQYGESNQPTITDVKILKGKYGDMKAETTSKTASLYTLPDVEFPLHLEIKSMGETFSFELLAGGKWSIDLNLKN